MLKLETGTPTLDTVTSFMMTLCKEMQSGRALHDKITVRLNAPEPPQGLADAAARLANAVEQMDKAHSALSQVQASHAVGVTDEAELKAACSIAVSAAAVYRSTFAVASTFKLATSSSAKSVSSTGSRKRKPESQAVMVN